MNTSKQKSEFHRYKVRNNMRKYFLAIFSIIIILMIGLYHYPTPFQNHVNNMFSPIRSLIDNVYARSLEPSHEELIEYTLILINQDRVKNGLSNLTLDTNLIAQEYADYILDNNVFEHNPNLPKSMAENIAKMYSSGWFRAYAKKDIEELHYSMMYNDAELNRGYRDNILNPSFTRVSIGIAYDVNSLYLIQDFS